MAKDYSKDSRVTIVGEGSAIGKVATPIFNAANDISETAGSIWQSVIDTAADALASGKEAVVGAGEAAYEALPEMEDVAETSDSTSGLFDTVTSLPSSAIKGAINLGSTVTSTPSKLFLQDLFTSDEDKGLLTIDEGYLQADEIEGLREIVRKKGVGQITKSDYGNVTIGDVRGGNKKNTLTGGLTLSDRLYNSLGDTTAKKNEETDEYYIDDTFDWNVYVDYTDESNGVDEDTGRLKGKVYKTEEFESQLSPAKEFWKTVTSGASIFEKAHNIAFLFGSRDYVDSKKDTGRKIRINLGKL